MIVANIYRVKKGDKVLKCLDYYTGEEREIPLDERLSPSKTQRRITTATTNSNAQRNSRKRNSPTTF